MKKVLLVSMVVLASFIIIQCVGGTAQDLQTGIQKKDRTMIRKAVYGLVNGNDDKLYHIEQDRQRQEVSVINTLCHISNAQEEFKKQKVKDQNKNGIGEYASNTELIDFVKAERAKKSELSKLILSRCLLEGKGNLIEAGLFQYWYRVFIPEEPEMQEQYWLARAIRDPKDMKNAKEESSKFYRSYFYYNKIDMIFYTDWDLSKLFKGLSYNDKTYKDPWTLKTIFFGEPFKSPINTVLWKVFDDPNPAWRIYGFRWYGE